MTDDYRSGLLRFADTAVAEKPDGGSQIGKLNRSMKRRAQSRPHLWPQPSDVSPKRMYCLRCGVAFLGQRAEEPCEPSD